MKKIFVASILACVSVILLNPLLEGRDGRGGGGGGGGRKGGGGGAINRSPSMSRVAQRPSPVTKNIQKPTRTQINNRIQQTPRNAQDFTKKGNQTNQQRLNSALQDRTKRSQSNTALGQTVRSNIADQLPEHGNWFDNKFNHDHGIADHIGEGNAWKVATWGAVRNWNNNWGWNEPYYYDYGGYDDENYVYPDQAEMIETTASQPAPSGQSLSLGVFAVADQEESDVTPNIFMSLSVDKSGNIDGTLYNSLTEQAYPLEGIVDKSNQRAAWMMANSENSPIIETGIYNLTQDQTPARMIFADGSSKNIMLVRVKQ